MAIEPGAQFFHGTLSELNEGDTVTPRNKLNMKSNFFEPSEKDRESDKRQGIPEFNSGDHAYATTHASAADNYALEAAEKKRTKESGRPSRYVYEVEPLDASDLTNDTYGTQGDVTSYRSPSGFRVIKRHS